MFLDEFTAANSITDDLRAREQHRTIRLPPQEGFVRVNFDAAVAIRDHKGKVLSLLSAKKNNTSDPSMAECLALKEALIFAQDVEVEGESLLLVLQQNIFLGMYMIFLCLYMIFFEMII